MGWRTLFIVVLVGIAGYAGSPMKKEFDYTGTKPHVIALLPVLKPYPLSIDSVYLEVIKDRSVEAEFLAPMLVRTAMDSLNAQDLVAQVLALDPKSGKTSKLRSLANHLDSTQMMLLRAVCRGADLAFVPDFSLKKQSGAVVAKVTHRLYDLSTGDLIYQEKETTRAEGNGALRTGGLMGLIGGGGDVKEKDRPQAVLASLVVIDDGIVHLRDNVIFGK